MGLMSKSRLSIYNKDRLLEHFVAGTTTRMAAKLCKVIAFEFDQKSLAIFTGKIEVIYSYLGGVLKGRGGRGAAEKIPIFCLLNRGGKVYTKIIQDALG